MPSDDPIILNPPPKNKPGTQRTSIKPQGFESLKVMATKYTTYLWIFVAGLPQLYAMIFAMGPVPEKLQVTLWATGAIGLFASWVKQRIDAAQGEEDAG